MVCFCFIVWVCSLRGFVSCFWCLILFVDLVILLLWLLWDDVWVYVFVFDCGNWFSFGGVLCFRFILLRCRFSLYLFLCVLLLMSFGVTCDCVFLFGGGYLPVISRLPV